MMWSTIDARSPEESREPRTGSPRALFGTQFTAATYRSYIAYLDRGGLATCLVGPGQCVVLPFAYENIDLCGYASSERVFHMGRYPNWKPAANIKTAGKASNWTWWAY